MTPLLSGSTLYLEAPEGSQWLVRLSSILTVSGRPAGPLQSKGAREEVVVVADVSFVVFTVVAVLVAVGVMLIAFSMLDRWL